MELFATESLGASAGPLQSLLLTAVEQVHGGRDSLQCLARVCLRHSVAMPLPQLLEVLGHHA
jgi:hypothetical protein